MAPQGNGQVPRNPRRQTFINSQITGEYLSAGPKVVFRQLGGSWRVKPDVLQEIPPAGVSLGLFYGVVESQLAYQYLSRGIGCYDFPSDVLQSPKDDVNASGLRDDGANYLRLFQTLSENLSDTGARPDIMAALRELNGSVVTLERDLQQRNEIIVGHRVNPHGPFLSMPVRQQSEGFRRFPTTHDGLPIHCPPRPPSL